MLKRRAYLDYNATAPLVPAARDGMLRAMDLVGNPSSVHDEGRRARRTVEEARREVAALVGASRDHVIFTSGATEAASTVLSPAWRMGRGALRAAHLFVCAADHPCTLSGGRFEEAAMSVIGVDRQGRLRADDLESALDAHDRAHGVPMVAFHAANNETGVVQAFEEIGSMARAKGAIVVLDAVQCAGRVPLDIAAGYADFMILSAHKIGGPMGAGAIVGSSDLMMPAAMVRGGGQEMGHRAGTENVTAIAGFGAAARLAREALDRTQALADMRDRFEAEVQRQFPAAIFHGAGGARLCNTSFFSLPGIKAETAQIAFDLAGVALSAGSACSSGKVGQSHVLKAMGVDGDGGALRVSISVDTSDDDLTMFASALEQIASRMKGRTANAA